MVCSILSAKDYDHPENFVCTADNTFTREFKVHERYPNFDITIDSLRSWWAYHVEGGESPEWGKNDAHIIKELKTTTADPSTELKALLTEADWIMDELDALDATTKDKQKRLDIIKDALKEYGTENIGDSDTFVYTSPKRTWTMSRSKSESIDKKLLKEDGLFDKYVTYKETYRMTVKNKED